MSHGSLFFYLKKKEAKKKKTTRHSFKVLLSVVHAFMSSWSFPTFHCCIFKKSSLLDIKIWLMFLSSKSLTSRSLCDLHAVWIFKSSCEYRNWMGGLSRLELSEFFFFFIRKHQANKIRRSSVFFSAASSNCAFTISIIPYASGHTDK